jgi:hypothetical protein
LRAGTIILRICAGLVAAVALYGCAGVNSQSYSFATLDEAREAGAIAKGWIPDGLPASSHDIRVAQVPGTSHHWGIINFPHAEEGALRDLLQPGEVSLAGEHCDMPARIEWWPVVLRGRLDGDQLSATGLRGYRARSGNRLFAVNWSQGRAYYWEAVAK